MANHSYHAAAAYVYVGEWALELSAIWDGVQAAEDAGIPLEQIGSALTRNWKAVAVALARKNIATLRALIADEAGR